jgi:DNA-binding CsgD family transcriptional regulator
LLPYAERNVVVGVPICFGAAASYLGCLAATLLRWPEAAHHFDGALAMNSRLGAKPHLARTQYYYAAMLRAQGRGADREKAARLADEANATAQELGMTHLVEQLRPLLAEPAYRRAPPAHPDRLTQREVDVLRLIAAGSSTKEIAATLVISEPTVERHITNLYAKIGARSRADATAYTLRKGLA